MITKPCILHIIDHTGPGGSQTQLMVRFQELQERFNFSLAVLGRSGVFTDIYSSLGVKVTSLPGAHNRWSLGSFLPLLNLIRREKPDLIHAHLFKSMSFAALAARLTGTPCIIQDHSAISPESLKFYFPNTLSRSLYTLSLKLTVKSDVRLLVFTPEIRDSYVRHFQAQAEKISVLPNGIDLDRFQLGEPADANASLRAELGLAHDCKLIVMIGRFAEEKDWPLFLQIAGKFPDPARYAFVAVGSGELRDRLWNVVRENVLSNVHFLGQRKDVPAILKEANAFLLTSRFEAFPNVILEAMASGCPVIATRTVGTEFLIQHETNGILVKVGDVDGFVDNLERVLTDVDLAHRLVQNACRSIVQYDSRLVSAKMAEMYLQIIRAHRIAQQ